MYCEFYGSRKTKMPAEKDPRTEWGRDGASQWGLREVWRLFSRQRIMTTHPLPYPISARLAFCSLKGGSVRTQTLYLLYTKRAALSTDISGFGNVCEKQRFFALPHSRDRHSLQDYRSSQSSPTLPPPRSIPSPIPRAPHTDARNRLERRSHRSARTLFSRMRLASSSKSVCLPWLTLCRMTK